MKEKIVLNEQDIINDYNNGMGAEKLALKYHVGKLKINTILDSNGVVRKKRGGQNQNKPYVVSDWSIEKYPMEYGFEYIAKAKDGNYETRDYMNAGGFLTSYIKKVYDIKIPTLYDRREYYKLTGNYWWEQWFNIVKVEKKPTKKCPYCDWETVDVENKAGVFEQHLLKVHNITKHEYLKEFPEDKKYFELVNKSLNRAFENDESKFVTCAVCGRKLARIDSNHLSGHGLTKLQYIEMYGTNTVCKDLHNTISKIAIEVNKCIEHTYTSKAEEDIKYYINNVLKIPAHKNKKEIGEEIDIFIPSHRIGIEYDGLYWHNENHGKDKHYHLNKTELCNQNNIKLIHIFEDEYVLHKDIVFAKIKHILKKDNDLPRIMGRKCMIKLIDKTNSDNFLEKYHIQGKVASSIYIGVFHEDVLVAVMTFLEEKDGYWNLTRFATDYHYRMQGVASKVFYWFVKNYKPINVKSFADRRWTMEVNKNLYTNLGFKLSEVLQPEYRYYNVSVDKYTRFHKFGFRKQALHKKYGFPLTMTEREMTKELGYDRIWDCGLFKYVWTSSSSN